MAILGAVALLLAACAGDDSILPGEREAIRDEAVATVSRAPALRLSAAVDHAAWPQRAGTASHAIRHPALAAEPVRQWAVPIGAGNDRKHRITADPVADGSRIYALDSRARVTAVTPDGQTAWSVDLTPAGEDPDDASGGGLAVDGGQLFVTTGFAELVALDAASGAVNWRHRMEAASNGAPTVANGLVYVVTRDSRGWAIDPATGRIRWQVAGAPSASGVAGAAAPAADKGIAIFPFASAQVAATYPKGGFRLWNGSAAGRRVGPAYGQISDITGDPVISGRSIYVGNPSGLTVALDRETGEKLWIARDGATGPVWVDGGSVFLVSDQAALIRLDAASGKRVWAADLPGFVPRQRQRRLRDVYVNYGPVLAGGRLWVASSDGHLRAFDPATGAAAADIDLGGAAASRPIVVSRTMYIILDSGELAAFR